MKIAILCGGYGSRLAGAGNDLPKPMVPIGGRPILWHIMKGFAHTGFKDFVLCLGHRSDIIKQYFLNLPLMLGDVTFNLATGVRALDGASEPLDWTITFAETGQDSMTGHRIRRIASFVQDDDVFGVTYGDGVTDLDFRDVVRFHRDHGRLATVTAVHPPGRFGDLSLEKSGQVSAFNEKPQVEAGWISGGFFVFSRGVLDRLSDDPTLMLEQQPLRQLAHDGELMAYRHQGFWSCVDTPRDLRQLSEGWATGHAPWAVWEKTG